MMTPAKTAVLKFGGEVVPALRVRGQRQPRRVDDRVRPQAALGSERHRVHGRGPALGAQPRGLEVQRTGAARAGQRRRLPAP